MRVQLFPHHEDYFAISTHLLIFPVRVFIKNVKN